MATAVVEGANEGDVGARVGMRVGPVGLVVGYFVGPPLIKHESVVIVLRVAMVPALEPPPPLDPIPVFAAPGQSLSAAVTVEVGFPLQSLVAYVVLTKVDPVMGARRADTVSDDQ